ncbi:MAG TPA: phosphate ABC transporter substrate-binding protein PstS [Usitatibacter sp.]|jgi:phosphate transport system substrate-binding protein|nr:phosphate ABC transporter substrate-binding protein PstS [Usitatibacter sp.]
MRISKALAALAVAATSLATSALAADITGAGATFPYPVYAKWAEAYKKATGVGLNYQSIGSGGGIKQIEAKTVDFGASDMPLSPEDLEKNGLMQFPAIMGGVVPVVKLEGIGPGQLHFTGGLLADIYLGKVTKWNDAEIAKLNPGVKLPATDITVVHRSDGSGTNFLWTNYLSQVSPEFKEKVGEGTSVKWPSGVGGKGNEGVASYVQKIDGALGYVEYAYAKQNKLAYALMQNRNGKYVSPTDETFAAAASNADWKGTPGMRVILTNQPGDKAWPITGASYILMHVKQEKPENGREVLKFYDWAFKNGARMAEELDYVPMPANVVQTIHASWKKITDPSGKPLV